MKKQQKSLFKIWLLRIVILLGSLFLLLFSGYLYIAFFLPIPDSLYLRPDHVSSKILDRHGALLYEVLSPTQGRKTYLKLDQMPGQFIQAILVSEDSNYYEHIGVDLGAISRAIFFNYLEQKVTSGASTITQQLVRNLLGTNRERNLQEKLIESIYAIRLSHLYNKDEILEQYLNTVYFGNLSYGAGEAARNYFGKNLQDLDLAEISLLAGLPKSPSNYNPLTNLSKAKKRQEYVLNRLVESGNITAEKAQEALNQQLKFASGKTAIEAPHFVHHILAELEDKYGEDFVYSGISVKTTLDLSLQKKAEQIIDFQLEKLKDKNVTNAALLSADLPTGQILVWIGSRDYFNDQIAGQVDIINSLRQPGSALKPFLYLLALESGDTLATIIDDLPFKIKTESGIYSPLNYDLDFHGPVRIREALANSFNIPAVKTQEKIGTAKFLNFLHNLGLSSLDKKPDYYGSSLTLGGGEIRLYDLANAYFTLSNYGKKKDFVDILEINDWSGKNIFHHSDSANPSQSLLGPKGQQNAYLIVNTLSDPNARLKSFGEGNVLELSFPAAAKTGTTRNFKDNWTFGFSPSLLTAVWVGNSDASAMENISGIDGAGPIWHDFMEYSYTQQKKGRSLEFKIPAGIEKTTICTVSGLLKSKYCQDSIDELFTLGTSPKVVDYYWQQFQCQSGLANYIVYPFLFADWAKDRGFQAPLDCQQMTFPLPKADNKPDKQRTIEIISPIAGDAFKLDENLPLTNQKIPIKIFVYPNSQEAMIPLSSQIRLSINDNVVSKSNLENTTQPAELSATWVPERGVFILKVEISAPNGQLMAKDKLIFQVN